MKMQTFPPQRILATLAILTVIAFACLLTISCGSGSGAVGSGANTGGTSPSPSGPVAVSIEPNEITVGQGDAFSFKVFVTGTNNTTVTWSVQEGPAGGSVTSSGVYTAANTAGVFHVVATSQADPTKSSTATVTVPAVSVFISPTEANVIPGATFQFTAQVTGTVNTAVSWSLQEGNAGGTVTSTGTYTAPASLGTFHLIATSAADQSKSAAAAITVVSPNAVFTPTGSMIHVGGIHTATLLPDGKLLVAGGSQGFTEDFEEAGQTDAELYDPATHLFITTGSMTAPRDLHTATLLLNGKVLMAGGFGAGLDRPPTLSSAEVYDPATASFSTAGNMSTVRAAHAATLLPDGKVLIAGGGGQGGFGFPAFNFASATAEVYDPSTNSFSLTGAMGTARYAHTATPLPNGKILIAGGFTSVSLSGASNALSTAELYDPTTGTFTPTGSMATARGGHTSTLLSNGQVLITGGLISVGPLDQSSSTCGGGSPQTVVALTTELYDPAAGVFTPTGDMTTAREEHTATLLPDGKVLLVGGGTGSQGVLNTAEIYDPGTGLFTVTPSMETPRSAQTATLLPDGTVLVAGGNYNGGRVDTLCSYATQTAEIFRGLP